jgi:hypothetical protein
MVGPVQLLVEWLEADDQFVGFLGGTYIAKYELPGFDNTHRAVIVGALTAEYNLTSDDGLGVVQVRAYGGTELLADAEAVWWALAESVHGKGGPTTSSRILRMTARETGVAIEDIGWPVCYGSVSMLKG